MRRLALVGVLVLALVPGAAGQSPLLATGHTVICFLDINGDGAHTADEPVYLQVGPCGAGTAAGDIRFSSSAGFAGGTIVSAAHDDAGRSTTAGAGQYAYEDLNGDGAYSGNDAVWLHFGALPGQVTAGDLPLSGSSAFRAVAQGDPSLGHQLVPSPVTVGGESYREQDGNNGFSTGDFVFLDMDGNGFVTIGDLRLAGPTPAPTTSSSTSSTTTTSATQSLSEIASSQAPNDAVPAAPGSPAAPGPPESGGKSRPSTSALVELGLLGMLAVVALSVLVKRSH